jgi:DNA-binding response OmpR family regulator
MSPVRALVIEDDEKIGSFVVRGLQQETWAVDWARDGMRGRELLTTEDYDVAVVDRMLPGLDGLSIIREARRRGITTPLVVLSARAGVEDRISGLREGADDYLVKPFSFSELLARIQAVLRRTAQGSATRLSYDDLTLDLRTRKVTREGKEVQLQSKELALLEFFLRNPERVLSKTLILEHVWDYSFDPQTNVVDVLVSRLRAKVDRPFKTKLIHTLRGLGYVLRRQ